MQLWESVAILAQAFWAQVKVRGFSPVQDQLTHGIYEVDERTHGS